MPYYSSPHALLLSGSGGFTSGHGRLGFWPFSSEPGEVSTGPYFNMTNPDNAYSQSLTMRVQQQPYEVVSNMPFAAREAWAAMTEDQRTQAWADFVVTLNSRLDFKAYKYHDALKGQKLDSGVSYDIKNLFPQPTSLGRETIHNIIDIDLALSLWERRKDFNSLIPEVWSDVVSSRETAKEKIPTSSPSIFLMLDTTDKAKVKVEMATDLVKKEEDKIKKALAKVGAGTGEGIKWTLEQLINFLVGLFKALVGEDVAKVIAYSLAAVALTAGGITLYIGGRWVYRQIKS